LRTIVEHGTTHEKQEKTNKSFNYIQKQPQKKEQAKGDTGTDRLVEGKGKNTPGLTVKSKFAKRLTGNSKPTTRERKKKPTSTNSTAKKITSNLKFEITSNQTEI
jgi:hypothetical protein